uniref:RanBP2-type domain-containing protein n=1 Tax=Peronospora matthiolae TaxID=2874970 RepID=A0AAV1VIH6_9STRA
METTQRRSTFREQLTRPYRGNSSRQRRSHDRQQSECSRHKRSRSCSRSSERKLRSKKEKKRHKIKQMRDKPRAQESSEADVLSVQSAFEPITEQEEKEPEQATPVDVKRFFEQLQKQEVAKKPVGTVHSRGVPPPVSATAMCKSDKWECSKATCGHTNSKHTPACTKCGALKRMTEWR